MATMPKGQIQDVAGCLACDLARGRRPLPGGMIHATGHWAVEHCVGPLGVGTLIVKPLRHVRHLWELREDETAELGPLLGSTSAAIAALLSPDQVYVCLWSHSGWEPVHIHFVLQPLWGRQREQYPRQGPFLQAEMFANGETPAQKEVEALAQAARQWMSAR